MKFSVIVPIYNVEKYLNRCLDSILSQKHRDLEIILVDDGSNDRCPEICDSYGRMDDRVKVIHKKNGGLVSARKAGAEICTGDYVLNVDGDDWISEDLFLKADRVLESSKADVFCFNYYLAFENENRVFNYIEKDELLDESGVRERIIPSLIEDKKGRLFCSSIWSKIIRRDMYMASQLSVDDRIKIGEDVAVSKPIIARVSSLYLSSGAFYYYRQNLSSMMNTRRPYDINSPKRVGEHLLSNMDPDFRPQIARYVVHNLFNACTTQFYGKLSYKDICKGIGEVLSDEFCSRMIRECRYSIRNVKGTMALFALRHKLYFLMKKYSKVYSSIK